MTTSKLIRREIHVAPGLTWTKALVTALLLSTPVFAQESDESEQASPPTEDAVSSGTDPDAGARADSVDGETGTATDSQRPPDNYRPSEDISEDLGVSFPVDI